MGEVLFPGVLAIALGLTGIAVCWRRDAAAAQSRDDRETLALYGSLGLLTFWASFGPPAGLYTVLYRVVPLFTFLRAPSRFGLLVVLVLAIFAAIALARMISTAVERRRRSWIVILAAIVAVAELNVVPFPWERALPVSTNYRVLASMPRAVVAEFPFYGERVAFPLHAQYMALSTTHWMPLVNGYSDYIPQDFRQAAFVLDSFPSTDTFKILEKHRVRYVGIHWDMYGPRAEGIRTKLKDFTQYLRPLAADDTMSLYEIVSFP
jgi:hypothetical protein